ncbi:hypothetical protein PG987_012524 [Apiospora arundinis]|uniref:Cell-cycle control medial ring component n=1 Tax=Apiospora arundinis TaxID=335852 RepID=A0ABR2IFQ7_9PEZI
MANSRRPAPPPETLYTSYPFPTLSTNPRDLATMTEATFAKQFLAALDSRPVKLSADHVEDPRSYPARSAYTLPRPTKPMSKPKNRSGAAGGPPGSEHSFTVVIKSLRNPPLDLKLTSQTPNTSMLDLKAAVAAELAGGVALEKIKMLYKKKPVVDSKVLKELAEEGGPTTLEFSVMVMGGAALAAASASASAAAAASPKTAEAAQADVAQGTSGSETLQSPEFWDDLKGFLLQRIRDEKEATKVFDTFQTAWKAKG